MMSYEKLDVYQCSIEFLGISLQILGEFPRGQSILHDQLKRATLSIPLNIAEGAGKKTKADCSRYFTSARGSAMECGAVLDVGLKMSVIDQNKVKRGKLLLERIVAMLTKMSR
jgi:four helix bundle protein